MKCKLCSEEKSGPDHDVSPKHLKNKALYEYAVESKKHVGNRKGAVVKCTVKSSFSSILDNSDAKIKISVKPKEEVKFNFTVYNESKKEDLLVIFIHIPTNKLNFVINNQALDTGCVPQCLKPKQKLRRDVCVSFSSDDIGQYQMPIAFLFQKTDTKENIFIIRDMVVFVEEKQRQHQKIPSPYADKEVTANSLLKTDMGSNNDTHMFGIPKNYKMIYARGLKLQEDAPKEMADMAKDISNCFEVGATKENYVRFFHNLLWYEETIVRINLKKYNMSEVPLSSAGRSYSLLVPGLAEKRPSLLVGDLLFIKPSNTDMVMFEGVISEINNNTILINGLHHQFSKHYSAEGRFDVRFFLSRLSLERMHMAVDSVFRHKLEDKVFPKRNPKAKPLQENLITEFYNVDVERNYEQRVAVSRLVHAAGAPAPYLLHGPPGTGKTRTLTEAALQLVARNNTNRVLICTDSNMAADHVATVIAEYAHRFPDNLLLRASSKHRVWGTLPKSLYKYSNGTSADTYENVPTEKFLSYRIVVTTLLHSAKFVRQLKGQRNCFTHLMIDEAAQASEPACLVPCALLRARGHLLLAGDPLQLGPCVISPRAALHGLGTSLMERLMKMDLYKSGDPDYVMMLLNNFRSHSDILQLPNELFYNNKLNPCADCSDALSSVCVLPAAGASAGASAGRAIAFHAVLSQDQRHGKSPSYFNMMELELIQKYVTALIQDHGVQQEEIGVVTPYIRQVYKTKEWLSAAGYARVEAGTVEAFQGKEKRAVIISCVRANHRLLQHDARYQLGFLVDDKRFNVAMTRARSKLIVIGNPLVLRADRKWRRYMQLCQRLGAYQGPTLEQLHADIQPLLDQMKLHDN